MLLAVWIARCDRCGALETSPGRESHRDGMLLDVCLPSGWEQQTDGHLCPSCAAYVCDVAGCDSPATEFNCSRESETVRRCDEHTEE